VPNVKPQILDQLPHPQSLRARIAALDREASYLRRLLRLVLRKPPSTGPVSHVPVQEVAHAG
jgi:hypothetical protein